MSRRVLLTILLAVPFLASAAQFRFGTQTLTVPDGFEVERIAGPPLVDRPISASFDEQGRLYVTDSSGMSGKAPEQVANPTHRVIRLEDTDGDGRFDRRTVFAEKMMFPEGCLWYEGSLYVSGVPQIWKLTDTKGDGVADRREVWHDGKTVGGCANDLHGPYLGLDGWMYWCKGAWAEQTYGKPGEKSHSTRAAHIFRARPDGTGQEPVLTGGMDNPVGVAFAATGERFLSCTFYEPGNGKRDGLIHAIYGGIYGKPHESTQEHPQTGDLMPGLVHMGAAAPCGFICYHSQGLGEDYAGSLFACYFNLHKVIRHELEPDGATYKTKDTDFVVSDSVDFHPTDVLEDADGSLIVVDTGGWYKVCCPTSQIAKPDVLGGIYRVRRVGAPHVEDPRGLKLAWGAMESKELAKLLGDARLFVRQRTIAELGKLGEKVVPALRKIVKEGTAAETRQNAVWALARIKGEAAREATRVALGDTDSNVAHTATHVAGLWRDTKAVDPLLLLINGPRQDLARAAAEALGRIGDNRAVPALLAAAGKLTGGESSPSGNPATDAAHVLEHSLIYALIEIGDPRTTSEGLASANPRTHRAALVALDQIEAGGLKPEHVVPLMSNNDPVLQRTAGWIVSHRPAWGATLVTHFRDRLTHPPTNEEEREALGTQLGQLAKSAEIQGLLAKALREPATPQSRLIALGAISVAGLKETPTAWLDELASLLHQTEPKVLKAALSASRSLTLPKGGHAGLMAALIELGHLEKETPEIRLGALAAAGRLTIVEPALFDFLTAQSLPVKRPGLRTLAVGILAKAKLSSAQQAALAGMLKRISPLDLPNLLPAFAQGGDETSGLALVTALKEAPGRQGLRAETLTALWAKYTPSVRQAGQTLIAELAGETAKQGVRLDELIAKLPVGDSGRGQVLFTTKAGCVACHTIGKVGVNFGPDLTSVGQVRTVRDLLESIVYPSASFVRSYEPYTVVTTAGEELTGLLRKDAPDEVILALAALTERRFPRQEIKELRPGTISLMPQGFDQILTPQELADLLAYVKAGK